MNARCSVHALPSCEVVGWTVYQGSADVVLGAVLPLSDIRLRSPDMVRHCECSDPVLSQVRIAPDFGGGWASSMCATCRAIVDPDEDDLTDVDDATAEQCALAQRSALSPQYRNTTEKE